MWLKKYNNNNKKGKIMYIIDHTKQLVKQFNKKELAYFLNDKIIKKRYLACANKSDAKKCIRFMKTGIKK